MANLKKYGAEFIQVYNKIIPKNLCEKIINKFERDPSVKPGKVLDGFDRSSKVSEKSKKLYELKISESKDSEWKDLDLQLSVALTKAIKKYVKKFPQLQMSGQLVDIGYSIKRYRKGTDEFYNWHIDSNFNMKIGLQFSIVMYLNDVEKGGETEFKLQRIKVYPKQGSVLIFPTSFAFPHRGNKAISNTKYSANSMVGVKWL